MDKMNLDHNNLDKMITDGYINVQKHPEFDLWIYNYSHTAQFDGIRNNEVEMCRGLIMDADRRIVARPFRKFYNYDQAISYGIQFPLEDFEVTEKEDGSLGILYKVDHVPYIATRGSFVSDQAIKATEMLRLKADDSIFDPQITYLFEIVYPENRIVIDYGKREDLILLGMIETATAREVPYDFVKRWGKRHSFSVVKRYDGMSDFAQLEVERSNAEGYVLYWPSTGQRAKVKFSEYKRLHKILTGTNSRRIWEILSGGNSLNDILELVPDEFYEWVQKTTADLNFKYKQIELIAKCDFDEIKHWELKKSFALAALEKKYPHLLFAMREGKDYSQAIWKMIKPVAEKPFKIEN